MKPISGSTTIADSTVEVEVDPIVQGEEVTEEDITETVMAGVVTEAKEVTLSVNDKLP